MVKKWREGEGERKEGRIENEPIKKRNKERIKEKKKREKKTHQHPHL